MSQLEEKQEAMLSTVADGVSITEDKIIKSEDSGDWRQIMVNHVIDTQKDKITSCKIKIKEENGPNKVVDVMVGVATKHIASLKNCYSGQYMYGYLFGSAGYHYNFGSYWNNLKKWAPNDVIEVQICNYTLTLFVNDYKSFEWEMKKYPHLHEQELIPVICITRGSCCEFLGIEEK